MAEDNPINVKMLNLLLSRMGYRADVAANGIEAIAALRRQTYDVILMDVTFTISVENLDHRDACGQITDNLIRGYVRPGKGECGKSLAQLSAFFFDATHFRKLMVKDWRALGAFDAVHLPLPADWTRCPIS